MLHTSNRGARNVCHRVVRRSRGHAFDGCVGPFYASDFRQIPVDAAVECWVAEFVRRIFLGTDVRCAIHIDGPQVEMGESAADEQRDDSCVSHGC